MGRALIPGRFSLDFCFFENVLSITSSYCINRFAESRTSISGAAGYVSAQEPALPASGGKETFLPDKKPVHRPKAEETTICYFSPEAAILLSAR